MYYMINFNTRKPNLHSVNPLGGFAYIPKFQDYVQQEIIINNTKFKRSQI